MTEHQGTAVADAAIECLTDTQRALLCCLIPAKSRRELADQVARMTHEAILHNLVAPTPLRDASQETLALFLQAHIADLNAYYAQDREGESR